MPVSNSKTVTPPLLLGTYIFAHFTLILLGVDLMRLSRESLAARLEREGNGDLIEDRKTFRIMTWREAKDAIVESESHQYSESL